MRYLYLFLFVYSSILSARVDVKTYIPEQANDYLQTVYCECLWKFEDFEYPHYFAALIEHESCIHLKHSKCWNPRSQLKTKRELGIGLGQLTKAYKKDGTLRFDSLTEMKRKYSVELKELSWENIRTRPDLQIRTILLMSKGNYKQLYAVKDQYQRMAMMDAAYNGGLRSVFKRRRICGLKKDCDPQTWFDNLEHIVVKSTKPLYAGRSAQQINTEHVHDVLKTRMSKYKPLFNVK